ncbi:MAG TPA: cation diffusion facilitator family transporter [Thermoplasmata archaeon]|nr:cation diffusion facilitator family transporter [Thermoplasmata archaeon]
MAELVHGESEAAEQVLSGLRLALGLSFVILLLEGVGAFFSRSLSLTVDTVHNIPDILAFAASWTALRATERGSTAAYTFGMHRFEVFAGLLNALLVLATGAVFGFEAATALWRGSSFSGPVDAVWVLAVAIPTFGLRSISLAVLGRLPKAARELNLLSVVVHLASDVVITGALLVAGAILLLHPQAAWVDAVAALVIAVILVYESLPLFRAGWEVLTERVPRNLSVERIHRSALAVPGVREVHDLHVWAVCPTLVCMTAHVRLDAMSLLEGRGVISELRTRMASEFGILHSVFEMEGPSEP